MLSMFHQQIPLRNHYEEMIDWQGTTWTDGVIMELQCTQTVDVVDLGPRSLSTKEVVCSNQFDSSKQFCHQHPCQILFLIQFDALHCKFHQSHCHIHIIVAVRYFEFIIFVKLEEADFYNFHLKALLESDSILYCF